MMGTHEPMVAGKSCDFPANKKTLYFSPWQANHLEASCVHNDMEPLLSLRYRKIDQTYYIPTVFNFNK